LHRILCIAGVIGALATVIVAFDANAFSISPVPNESSNVTLVAGGCGLGSHPGPYGGCRPNIGGVYQRGYELNGSLDQFSISNVLRSQTYIAQHSLAGSVFPVDANTVLAYNFSEAGGTIAHDLSSNGYNATLSSSSMWTRGPSATLTSAVQVSSGQEINAGSVLAYDKNRPWTIMAGINVAHNPASAAVIASNLVGSGSAHPGYQLWIDPSGHLRLRLVSNFSAGNYIDVQSGFVVTDGNWHEVTVSYGGSGSASGIKFYLDGAQDTATKILNNSLTGSIVSSTHGPLIVGNQPGYESTYELNGSLDQFSISNVLRSQTYIAQHWLAGSVFPVDANTVLAYNFSEAGGTIAHDLSSNGYSATLSSSSMWTRGPSATLTSAVQVSSGQEINAGSVLAYDKNRPWTIMAGINVAHNPTEAAVIFTNVNAVPYPGYELWIDPSGHLRVRIISNFLTGNFIDVQGSVVVTDGKWHEVAASYNGSSLASGVKIYVAGVLDTATKILNNSLTGSIVSSTHGPLIVGNQT
jgi:hypothetical protein